MVRRRNEIGIRVALGATRGRIVRMILGETAVLVGVGVAVGLGLAVFAARAAASLLFGLEPWDPVTLAGAVGTLALAALLAVLGPARRAATLQPVRALREE
ncbi:MAG: FtsX-like permease family protein [Vicinamibacterales bacterium]